MPKSRRRKQPIVSDPNSIPDSSTAAQACRNVIRQYHVLLKRRKQLENDSQPHKQSLADIDDQIKALGGLERYQQLSALGQREERGGGSEKVLINWLKRMDLHHVHKLRLLEVGALKPNNFQSCSSWIESMPIDLRSRHPSIIEQDFLLLDEKQHRNKWDAISLSLVLNFVPVPNDRGQMLQLAHEFLVPDGLLFFAVNLAFNFLYLKLTFCFGSQASSSLCCKLAVFNLRQSQVFVGIDRLRGETDEMSRKWENGILALSKDFRPEDNSAFVQQEDSPSNWPQK